MFRSFVESTLEDLFTSAVAAFPGTRRRQHATGTIKITELRWTPFLGVRTLFLRGHADNHADNGGEYSPMMLFRNVRYHQQPGPGRLTIIANDQQPYVMEPLREDRNDVLLRCDCGDFFWRFNYYDHIDNSLYGRVRRPYAATAGRGPINPTESPGMCKHLMKMMYALRDAGVLVS